MEKLINLGERGAPVLIFATGNMNKFVEARAVAERYWIDLRAKALEIAEIQSSDPVAVAQAKVKAAYRILKRPVVIHDSSWSVPALKGFPGAYVHDMVRWFEPEDWLNLIGGHSDRTVEVCENVVYYNGQTEKCFQYRQKGVFVDSPRGINGNSLEKVVVLADDQTIAEHHDLDINNNSVVLQVWEEFFEWYRDNLGSIGQPEPVKIRLEKVDESSRQALWNLLQYSLVEESATDGNHIQDDGTFEYKYFDNYFTDTDREAYLIKALDGELMGFVMINQYLQKVQEGHAIAEFLILPRFRWNGVGREVARRCFEMHPGNWEVSPADGSKSAYKFWKAVIDEVTGDDNQLEDGLFVFKVGE